MLALTVSVLTCSAQRYRNTNHMHGLDVTISRLVPNFSKVPDQNFLFHESLTYSIVAGQRIRAFAGINFLAPAKGGVTRYGFHIGFLAGSKNPTAGLIYGPVLFHIVNKTAYDNGALRNYHNTGLAFAVGVYYVPVSQFVLSTKIAPALYHYSVRKKNDIKVIESNVDSRSVTFYMGFYNLLSLSVGYRF